jgi:NAD(P)-dependent dehydrogenase (short-subunit alcohol dehydrogenase family)
MVLVKSATALVLFVLLYKSSDLLLPVINLLTNWIILVVAAWFGGNFLAKKFILPHLPQLDTSSKAVIITGCDTGFGHMTALRLNQDGFFVIACCLNSDSEGAKKLTKTIQRKDRLKVIQVDVTKEKDIVKAKEVVDEILTNDKNNVTELYAIVNNAGILINSGIEWTVAPSVEDFYKMMEVNFFGVVRMTRMFLPFLRKSKGRVVNIASQAARTSTIGFTGYSCSKAAVAKFTEGLWSELLPYGVKAISIEPFFIKTEIINMENNMKLMKNAWRATDEGVKQFYGQQGYHNLVKYVKFISSDPRIVNPRQEDCSDAIAEAILSPEPDAVYEVVRWNHWIPYYLIHSLPWEPLIQTRRLLEKFLLSQSPDIPVHNL